MKIIESKAVINIIHSYPPDVRKKLLFLRTLIFETATELDIVNSIEETLKWGEPAYISKHGSTIRIDWKEKSPKQYAMYFHCKTKLVDTFKELYRDTLKFDGNRAIIFNMNGKIPVNELKHCIELSLTYHQFKNLPLLGA